MKVEISRARFCAADVIVQKKMATGLDFGGNYSRKIYENICRRLVFLSYDNRKKSGCEAMALSLQF